MVAVLMSKVAVRLGWDAVLQAIVRPQVRHAALKAEPVQRAGVVAQMATTVPPWEASVAETDTHAPLAIVVS